MACSYLSTAGVNSERTMAGCWTPPYSLPEPETTSVTSHIQPPLASVGLPSAPTSEPALDLTTTVKPRAQSSSDDDSE